MSRRKRPRTPPPATVLARILEWMADRFDRGAGGDSSYLPRFPMF